MQWRITTVVRAMATLAVLPVGAAAVSGYGALVGLALPAAVWLVVAGFAARPEKVDGAASLEVERCAEGDVFSFEMRLSASGAEVDARLLPDRCTELVEVVEIETGLWRWTLRAVHWGRTDLRLRVTAVAHGGGWAASALLRCPRIVVEPAVEAGRATFRGLVSRPSYGERAVRIAGSGAEFLDVRLWAPGQPLRRVHWPATMRTGQLHVAGMAAQRNQDVLIVIDNIEGGTVVAPAAYDRSARAAVTLARAHLAVGDRVGLVVSSPDLFWQRLGGGRRQLIRLIDTIMDARRMPGYVKPRLDLLPRSVLTPGAVVVVLSPLLGEDSMALVATLRRRGHPTVVIDVLDSAPAAGGSVERRRAVRVWSMERESIRHDLAARGIVVIHWPAGVALAGLLAGASTRPIAAAAPSRMGARG